MKKLFIILAVLLLASYAMAANTTTLGYGTIKIVPDGTADWTWNTDSKVVAAFPTGSKALQNGLKVYSIQFNPSAADDIMIIHNGGINAIEVFNSGPAGGTAPIIKYFPQGKRIKLVMDASDCTWTTAASSSIYIEYEAE